MFVDGFVLETEDKKKKMKDNKKKMKDKVIQEQGMSTGLKRQVN